MLRTPRKWTALALLGTLGPACGGEPQAQGGWLELSQVRPRSSSGVFLNETLSFDFSRPVDPLSVTRSGLRIRDDQGRAARGVFRVEGERVRFLPDPVLEPDLSDGGFRPGTRYAVVMAGFPALDALRSADGHPLARTWRWSFETAHVTEPRGQMFEDRTPARGSHLVLRTRRTVRDAPVVLLECEEPVDPSTLFARDFHFVAPSGEEIEVRARLLRNSERDTGPRRAAAVIEIAPQAVLQAGRHELRIDPGLRLRDFGGNPLLWQLDPGARQEAVSVVEAGEQKGYLVQDFLDAGDQTTPPVPGADGTARWGQGKVTIRYPAAAGTGAAGDETLTGKEERKDLHATRIALEQDDECSLTAPGLVVLRAQGALRIRGRLARGGGGGPPMDCVPGERLSAWLARAIAEDPAWTVLIAGGDLEIAGEVVTQGPLLLVAGGWIRVSGTVRAEEKQLWLLGEGGGSSLPVTASRIELEIDPPRENPLRRPLRFAALSNPLPPWGGVESWYPAEESGSAGAGAFRVRFVRSELVFADQDWDPRPDPRQLDPPGRLRLLIELEIGPAPGGPMAERRWDPPLVDRVRLSWEREEGDAR